jgi:lactoylglutathione lyase
MRLAKQHLDIGIFTNRIDAQLRFWQEDGGLPFEEILPTGAGSRQHRHGLNGSVFKLNEVRDPLPAEPPSGYRELLIAREGVKEPRPLTDPDGNRVTLVPPGYEGVTAIGVRLGVTDEAAFDRFYRALGFEPVGDGAYRAGDTVIIFARDRAAQRSGGMRGIGYRYLTAQVWDADAEHAELVRQGVEVAGPPTTFGTVARIFFVRDPDGNWIEISQRASLTGPLPG